MSILYTSFPWCDNSFNSHVHTIHMLFKPTPVFTHFQHIVWGPINKFRFTVWGMFICSLLILFNTVLRPIFMPLEMFDIVYIHLQVHLQVFPVRWHTAINSHRILLYSTLWWINRLIVPKNSYCRLQMKDNSLVRLFIERFEPSAFKFLGVINGWNDFTTRSLTSKLLEVKPTNFPAACAAALTNYFHISTIPSRELPTFAVWKLSLLSGTKITARRLIKN